MQVSANIQYLQQKDIDKTKWDNCIANAPNGLVYGFSFYLDAMAANWDGLVLNDYEAVMPLTWNKKFGIYYLYQPFLIAQSGLFGRDISGELLNEFLKAIPTKFRLWEFPLNSGNLFHVQDFELYQRKNFVLNLNTSYENLYNNYNENVRRNIKKAIQQGCIVKTDTPIDAIIQLAKAQSKNYKEEDFQNFKSLFLFLKKKEQAKTYGVYTSTNELIASSVFLFSHGRAYYILVGNHPNGRSIGASHALIDGFIKDHAAQSLLLDFEGSDIPNLAQFYSSFGAPEEIYPAIKRDTLPWWIKWLKD